MGGLGDLLNDKGQDDKTSGGTGEPQVTENISSEECNSNKCNRDIEVVTIGNDREVGYCLSHGITLFREYSHIHTLAKVQEEE